MRWSGTHVCDALYALTVSCVFIKVMLTCWKVCIAMWEGRQDSVMTEHKERQQRKTPLCSLITRKDRSSLFYPFATHRTAEKVAIRAGQRIKSQHGKDQPAAEGAIVVIAGHTVGVNVVALLDDRPAPLLSQVSAPSHIELEWF